MLIAQLSVAGLDVFCSGLVLLGFITGVLTGLLGIGGGFLITPALRLIFGVPYPLAVAGSLVQIMAATMFSTYGHWRRGNVDVKLGVLMAGGSMVGAEAGVRLLQAITVLGMVSIGERSFLVIDLILNTCFIVLLLSVAVFMLRESINSTMAEPKPILAGRLRLWAVPPQMAFAYTDSEKISIWVPLAVSLIVGTFAGLLGIGGGFIGLPLMIYLIGLPTRQAVGTSTFQIFIASAYGSLRHWQEGNVDHLLVFWLILGAMIGVKLGVGLCSYTDVRTTRKFFAVALILAAVFIMLH